MKGKSIVEASKALIRSKYILTVVEYDLLSYMLQTNLIQAPSKPELPAF